MFSLIFYTISIILAGIMRKRTLMKEDYKPLLPSLLTFAPLALQLEHNINTPPKAMTEKSSLAEADRDARAVD
jgi:hypothetical protein